MRCRRLQLSVIRRQVIKTYLLPSRLQESEQFCCSDVSVSRFERKLRHAKRPQYSCKRGDCRSSPSQSCYYAPHAWSKVRQTVRDGVSCCIPPLTASAAAAVLLPLPQCCCCCCCRYCPSLHCCYTATAATQAGDGADDAGGGGGGGGGASGATQVQPQATLAGLGGRLKGVAAGVGWRWRLSG
jgi:hypothetical protein